ncbi:lipid IV(A) 4-amino-4-deoxy-L-arabinosyltransferase [Erwiniaceae bacterium CAU 1747]
MKSWRITLSLMLMYSLYYLIPLEYRALWQPDEVRYAEISREMLASGNWISPHFLGLRYFEKPVAGYWMNNLSQLLFGENNFSVRFGSVFSVTLSALLIGWLAMQIFHHRRTAWLAAIVFLTSLLVYGIGTYAVLDPMITLWLVAAMCCYWLAVQATTRQQKIVAWLLLGLACGMGFMTKGFLALAVPVVAIVPWAIWQGRFRELLIYGPLALIAAVAVSLPWGIAIARQQPDFWSYFFWVEHIQRFAEKDAQHSAPFWYYLPVLIAGSLPWLGLLPGALLRAGRQRHNSSGGLYLLSWVVMPLLFFSIAKGKLPTYILPCFAPLAILLADYAIQSAKAGGRALRANAIVNLAFGTLAALVVWLMLSPWGLSHRPVYQLSEGFKVALGGMAFLFWALMGAVTFTGSGRNWPLAALCPLGIALALAMVIPDKVVGSKQPQAFIQATQKQLADSRFILSNNSGMASAIAWQLKRTDIDMFEQSGELTWGLSYPDSRYRLVASDRFADWLAEHRRRGNVSLVLKLTDSAQDADPRLPTPDEVWRQQRMVLYYYHQQP